MVSSVLGQTRHAGFPSGAWSDRIDGLPASLEAVRGVRFDPDDAGSKAQADSGASAGGGAPVYSISKALLNKVPPSWTAWRMQHVTICHASSVAAGFLREWCTHHCVPRTSSAAMKFSGQNGNVKIL